MDRRNFLRGGLALIAAPAIVRASSLMPVRSLAPTERLVLDGFYDWQPPGLFRVGETIRFGSKLHYTIVGVVPSQVPGRIVLDYKRASWTGGIS